MRARRRAAALVAGGFVAVLVATAPPPLAAQEEPPAAQVELGQRLYTTGCSSCHGVDSRGTTRGPSLQGVGAASVDFWVSTGRMPLKSDRNLAVRKPPAYDREQVDAIVAYVTSMAPGGPPIPELRLDEADLVEGGELYRANCAACHGAAGIGGALASGRHAPALKPATPLQIAEAVRTGPAAMPNFGPDTFSDEQVASIAAYVESLDQPDDEGGFGLGHAGPIPEGFVGWLVGLGALLLACYWIGERE
ncbi:MAG: cytochrome bc1 complex diheme cytochrome c subunit [Acidimicrobiales bacterium]